MPGKKSSYLVALAFAVAGCSSSAASNYITIEDAAHIAVHARSGPPAVVSATGDLVIGGKGVVLNQNQRDLLVRYFADAMAVRSDGMAVGSAGTRIAGQALGSVLTALSGGDADKIGAGIDARAEKIDAEVARLCSDLAQLRSTQSAIAATLADFKPYASIDSEDASDCRTR